MTTISKDKTYRTRDGREVRIYATDGGGDETVHGAVNKPGQGWAAYSWSEDGYFWDDGEECRDDLIEVKPRFRIERWVNVYSNGFLTMWDTREEAMRSWKDGRIATKHIIIEGTEGEDDPEGK